MYIYSYTHIFWTYTTSFSPNSNSRTTLLVYLKQLFQKLRKSKIEDFQESIIFFTHYKPLNRFIGYQFLYLNRTLVIWYFCPQCGLMPCVLDDAKEEEKSIFNKHLAKYEQIIYVCILILKYSHKFTQQNFPHGVFCTP